MSLSNLRYQLSFPKASFQLALLGVIAGVSSALLIILFRWIIEQGQALFLVKHDDFTTLNQELKLALPLFTALIMAIAIDVSQSKHSRLGIPFVIYRIKTMYGIMPFRNALNQFFGGALALIAGFSVGREGPSVHLGASGSSFLGVWLKLPYNSIKILSGCGIAAGIAASFNTPLAAVIFVMEVIIKEYKVHIFIPIILSAVTGSLLATVFFGSGSQMHLLVVTTLDWQHYPYLIICGLIIGSLAVLFNNLMMRTIRFSGRYPIYPRILLAGIITAILGWLMPQALGSGLSTVQFSIQDATLWQLLLILFIAKFAATIAALGLGIPGGVIGPILGLGVLAGTILGNIPYYLFDDPKLLGTYAVICMAALLAASLHAPLAALVTVMELTKHPEMITPAMTIVAVSYTTAVQLFKNRSIFSQQLIYQKLDYRISPAEELLQQVGVLAKLNKNYYLIDNPTQDEIYHYLSHLPANEYLVVRNSYEVGSEFYLATFDKKIDKKNNRKIMPPKMQLTPLQGVSAQATLAEPFELLKEKREGAVYIYEGNLENIIGIIRWPQLRRLIANRNHLL